MNLKSPNPTYSMSNMIDRIEYKPEWQELATFVPNKKTQIYNWFYYKEGFSKELVDILLNMFGIRPGQIVLDPFCGSGTALLACRQRGINAVGFDVLPISVFASKVKTYDYDTEKLSEEKQKLIKLRFEKPVSEQMESVAFMKRFFSRYALEDIVFLRRAIAGIDDEDARDLLTLALINTALKVSYAWKDGAVLKIRKHPTPPMRKLFKRVLENMIKSLRNSQKTDASVTVKQQETSEASQQEFANQIRQRAKLSASVIVKQQDSRYIPLDDNSIDCVITSPPYYNNIDYTKVYEIENWFVNDIMKNEPSVRSYQKPLHNNQKFLIPCFTGCKLVETRFISGVEKYFEDMERVLEELYRVCKQGAQLAIIVGNGFDGHVIESDIILSNIAEKIGFRVEKIITVNERFALKDRTTKVGKLRESVIIMVKL